MVVLFVEVAALVLFNVPVALNLGSGVVGLHWSNVELSFSNLAYPFLPYVYLLFVLLGLLVYVVKVCLWVVDSKLGVGDLVGLFVV